MLAPSSRTARCGRRRRGGRSPAWCRAAARRSPLRRLRLRLPLRFSVLTLVDADAEGLLDRLADLDLVGARVDDEDVDAVVHQPVGLLRDDRADQHGSVAHCSRPPRCLVGVGIAPRRRSASARASSTVGLVGRRRSGSLGAASAAAASSADGLLGRGGGAAWLPRPWSRFAARPRRPSRRRLAGKRRVGEDDHVGAEHVVGGELVGRDARDVRQVARTSARRRRRHGRATTRTLPVALERRRARRARPWSSGSSKLQRVDEADPPLAGTVGRARSAAPAGPSSSASAARSCAASARGRRHRRSSAAHGSSPGGRCRCPSGGRAWRRRRRPRPGSWCSGCRSGGRRAGRSRPGARAAR